MWDRRPADFERFWQVAAHGYPPFLKLDCQASRSATRSHAVGAIHLMAGPALEVGLGSRISQDPPSAPFRCSLELGKHFWVHSSCRRPGREALLKPAQLGPVVPVVA